MSHTARGNKAVRVRMQRKGRSHDVVVVWPACSVWVAGVDAASALGSVVLFGGSNRQATTFADTWRFDISQSHAKSVAATRSCCSCSCSLALTCFVSVLILILQLATNGANSHSPALRLPSAPATRSCTMRLVTACSCMVANN